MPHTAASPAGASSRPCTRKPAHIARGFKWCPGCTSVLAVSAFGPDRSRPPLFLQGRCRGCVSKANGRRTPTTPTADQYAAKLLRAAQEHAEVFEIPCDLSALTLLPFPPVCVLTLDDLAEGDTPQAPSLAMLVDGPGFTDENSVLISGRARRRHLVIGAKAIREHLGNADVLPALTVATLLDALLRHNRLAWDAEAVAVACEVDALTVGPLGVLEIPRDGRKAKDSAAEASARQNWADLVDGKPYSRPFRGTSDYAEYIAWGDKHKPESVHEEQAIV